MAGILQRFKDIMAANINAVLDKAEDPEKMIDQYIRELESDLGKVKAETVAIMAEEKKAKRQLDESTAEMNRMQEYAQKAILAGNDDDARKFLEKKSELANQQQILTQGYEAARVNSGKMREMHDKLLKDMETLQSRQNAVKAKLAVAKTQQTMNKMGASGVGVKDNMSAFLRMEEKANRLLDEANAAAELDVQKLDETDALVAKYAQTETTSAVEDELAALKAQLGK